MAELGFHLPSLIVYLVNFGILFAALYFIGYKRILAILDQRSDRIRHSLEEADQVRSEATQARQDLEAQLGEARKAGQQERNQAIEKVREQFAELAISAAERVINRSLDRDAHRDLIEKALSDSAEAHRN